MKTCVDPNQKLNENKFKKKTHTQKKKPLLFTQKNLHMKTHTHTHTSLFPKWSSQYACANELLKFASQCLVRIMGAFPLAKHPVGSTTCNDRMVECTFLHVLAIKAFVVWVVGGGSMVIYKGAIGGEE